MLSKHFLLLAVLAVALATAPQLGAQTPKSDQMFTLQVGSFPTPEFAERFVSRLIDAGERPSCSVVQLHGRNWTRVFVGLFGTSKEAQLYGENILTRGVIDEFLVKPADASQLTTRPRRVTEANPTAVVRQNASVPTRKPLFDLQDNIILRGYRKAFSLRPSGRKLLPSAVTISPSIEVLLPVLSSRPIQFAPTMDLETIPRPDPATLALRFVTRADSRARQHSTGGLWISGDRTDALERLRWILGDENSDLINVESDGRVVLDEKRLWRTAEVSALNVDDPVKIAQYISSNEGLLLIVQLTQGRRRYLLHLGRVAPTAGQPIPITSSINLDRNFDSRINPYRRDTKKLDNELPPDGFDALVGIDPRARWYNLGTRSWVPVGEVTFHELSEAFAKVDLGLDYLSHDGRPGAHQIALEREHVLKNQRPTEAIVMTAGSNRVLRSQAEIRLFFADNPGANQR